MEWNWIRIVSWMIEKSFCQRAPDKIQGWEFPNPTNISHPCRPRAKQLQSRGSGILWRTGASPTRRVVHLGITLHDGSGGAGRGEGGLRQPRPALSEQLSSRAGSRHLDSNSDQLFFRSVPDGLFSRHRERQNPTPRSSSNHSPNPTPQSLHLPGIHIDRYFPRS